VRSDDHAFLPLPPIPPRSPHLNGKVERAQKTLLDEFYVTAELDSPMLADDLGVVPGLVGIGGSGNTVNDTVWASAASASDASAAGKSQ
jgi:hypothetical protein